MIYQETVLEDLQKPKEREVKRRQAPAPLSGEWLRGVFPTRRSEV